MEKFVIALVVCSVTMTLVAVIYSLLSKWLKNIQSSKWRYYTWILIFIGFIAIFKPTPVESAATVNLSYGYVQNISVGERKMSLSFLETHGTYNIIFTVWLVGFLFNIGSILYKQYSFNKSIKRLSEPVPKAVTEKAKKIAAELGTGANFKVVTVSEIPSPMLIGFWKSLLILPEKRYAEKELYLILKHELVHLKHHDLFIKAFMLFCGALHWFNPFMKPFIRSAEGEGELYCDETVMDGEDESLKKLYCQSILNAASAEEKRKDALIPAIASNFSFNKQGLKHRMKMILSFDKKYKLSIIVVLIFRPNTVHGNCSSVFGNTRKL